eukprot:1612492-Amphidinium_carterae.1
MQQPRQIIRSHFTWEKQPPVEVVCLYTMVSACSAHHTSTHDGLDCGVSEQGGVAGEDSGGSVSYTHLRAHETEADL